MSARTNCVCDMQLEDALGNAVLWGVMHPAQPRNTHLLCLCIAGAVRVQSECTLLLARMAGCRCQRLQRLLARPMLLMLAAGANDV